MKRKPIPPDQWQTFLNHFPNHPSAQRDKHLAITAHALALRISEAVTIRTDQIQNQHLHLVGKGGKYRVLPIPGSIQQLMSGLVAAANQKNTPYLFHTSRGRPVDPANIRKRFARVAKDAGIQHIHPHRLRHTRASELVQHLELHELQQLLGHSKLSTTGIYLHTNPITLAAKMQHL